MIFLILVFLGWRLILDAIFCGGNFVFLVEPAQDCKGRGASARNLTDGRGLRTDREGSPEKPVC